MTIHEFGTKNKNVIVLIHPSLYVVICIERVCEEIYFKMISPVRFSSSNFLRKKPTFSSSGCLLHSSHHLRYVSSVM